MNVLVHSGFWKRDEPVVVTMDKEEENKKRWTLVNKQGEIEVSIGAVSYYARLINSNPTILQ